MQESTFLNVWQIDSFEGGKGSRADYLQKIGANFSKKEKCYVNVTSISAESARVNLANGVTPDIIPTDQQPLDLKVILRIAKFGVTAVIVFLHLIQMRILATLIKTIRLLTRVKTTLFLPLLYCADCGGHKRKNRQVHT